MDIPGAEPELQGFSGPAWQKWHYNSSVQILVKGKGHGSVDLLGTVSKTKGNGIFHLAGWWVLNDTS